MCVVALLLCLLVECVFLFVLIVVFFFFKQKTVYEMRISDWSSDVCSSDLFHSAHQFLADDQLLDLRSAFVNAEDTHIAEEALDRGLAHIAGAAMEDRTSVV